MLQYKFIVDGEWKYDPSQPAMYDEMGNVNNVMEVHEFVPENLGGVSGFDPPPSPPSRCVQSAPRPHGISDNNFSTDGDHSNVERHSILHETVSASEHLTRSTPRN